MTKINEKLWKEVQQSIISVNIPLPKFGADGKPGDETAQGMLEIIRLYKKTLSFVDQPPKAIPAPPANASTDGSDLDLRTNKNILTLDPFVRPTFISLAQIGNAVAAKEGLHYRMISGTRSYEEQDRLWAKGRSAPGSKVTNARGGYSRHNFGIAGDFGVFDANGLYLDSTNPVLASTIHKAVADAVKSAKLPIDWGGDWTSFVDQPHFEYRTGLSTSALRERKAKGQSFFS